MRRVDSPLGCRGLTLGNATLHLSQGTEDAVDLTEHAHPEAQVTWRVSTHKWETALRPRGGGLRQTEALILPPWTAHAPRFSRAAQSVVLHLDPTFMARTADELLGTSTFELRGGVTSDPVLTQLGMSAATELRHAWRDTGFVDALVHVVAGHLVRHHTRSAQIRNRPSVAAERLSSAQFTRLCDLVEARLDNPPTVGEMAAALKLSFIEIALALGFSSQSHFTAVFRRQLGVTPGVYRDAASGSAHLSGDVRQEVWRVATPPACSTK